jgi:hypothetical protein
MVKYTEFILINDMIKITENLYIDCLNENLSVPSVFDFFNDEFFLRYVLNQQLLKGKCDNKVHIKYIKNLLEYPEGFGNYFYKYITATEKQTLNLLDIYYELKILSY